MAGASPSVVPSPLLRAGSSNSLAFNSARPQDINNVLNEFHTQFNHKPFDSEEFKVSLTKLQSYLTEDSPDLNYADLDFASLQNFANAIAQFASTQDSETQQNCRQLLGNILIKALKLITGHATFRNFLNWYEDYGRTTEDHVFKLMTIPSPASTTFASTAGVAPLTTDIDKEIGTALQAAARRLGLPITDDRAHTIADPGAR